MRPYKGCGALLVVWAALGGSGCIFSGTRSARKAEAMSKAHDAHERALRAGDHATAIAYDDQFLRNVEDTALRAERIDLFGRLIRQEVGKMGPVRDDNVEAIVRTLIAFRREAARDLSVSAEYAKPAGGDFRVRASVGGDKNLLGAEVDTGRAALSDKASAERRQIDLAVVDLTVIKPVLSEAAGPLSRVIDAAVSRGDFEHAVVLAAGASAELPPGNVIADRLGPLEAQAAAAHLERANKAGDQLPGARVLNARIARVYGAEVGALGEPDSALAAAAAPNWIIRSPGDCGDVDDLRGTVRNLETQLRAENYTKGPGAPLTMTVTFESCPLTPKVTETTEKIFLREEIQRTPHTSTATNCAHRKEVGTVQPGSYGSSNPVVHKETVGTDCTSTTTTTIVEEKVKIYDTQITKHSVHELAATGTIQIAFDGGTRERPFDLSVKSDEFTSWAKTEKREARPPTDESVVQAKERLHVALLDKIRGVTGQVLAAREAAYLTQIKAGPSLEADHAFFVASRIALTLEGNVLDLMTSPILAAAITNQPMPKIDLGATHAVRLPVVSIDAAYSEDAEIREVRGFIMGTLTGGVASASTTGGGASRGGIGSIALAIFPPDTHAGGGFRMSGGKADSWLIDIDFFGGYGFRVGWLSLSAIAGLGLDFTPGNDDGVGPTPSTFILPPGAYVEYGARIHYPSAYGSLELMYTKAFRTSSAMHCEKRGDVRLTTNIGIPLALTLRYVEYLDDVDGFLTPFSANDERIAKMLWLLGGVGF